MEPEPNELLRRVGAMWAGRQLERLFQEEVSTILGRAGNRGFPGAQPVSFAARHFVELKNEDYFVCEKTDGVRYLMYMTQDGDPPNVRDVHYLIDRKNNYWYIPGLHFPHHEDPTFNRFHTATILDGELVDDKYPDGHSEIRFLVFDMLAKDGQTFMNRPLDKRLAHFKEHIKGPYDRMVKASPEACQRFPFRVTDKETHFSYHMEAMFRDVIPRAKQSHGNDGLIFTCKNTPYKSGTDPHILKWKPPDENTVDFLLEIIFPKVEAEPDDPDQSPYMDYLAFPTEFALHVFYGTEGGEARYERHGSLHVTPEEWQKMKALEIPLQWSIVECFLERDDGANGHMVHTDNPPGTRWRFHRFREDKSEANHISTFQSVIGSIQDHVTEQDLIEQSLDIKSAWKNREIKAKQERDEKAKSTRPQGRP